jgi:hypothetical protein
MMEYCEYDAETEICLKVPRQSKTEVLCAISLVLHKDGGMSIAGPLDSPQVCGQMFEGAWKAIKKLRQNEVNAELGSGRIQVATNEVLKQMGIKRLG